MTLIIRYIKHKYMKEMMELRDLHMIVLHIWIKSIHVGETV
ncbi:hypothetical protein [Clostridium tertium]|nr:hypothetical protein [Clostridium tertium]